MYILKGGLKSDFYSTFLLGKYYRLDVTLKIVQAYLNNNLSSKISPKMMYILKGGLKSDFYSTFLLGKYYRLDVTLKIVQAYLNNNLSSKISPKI